MRFLVLFACTAALNAETFLVRNATVCDGTGRPCVRADVRVQGGVVRVVGKLTPQKDEVVMDATGRVLAPGFIDIHNHSSGSIDKEPLAATQVSQGITTAVFGPDGGSAWPIAEAMGARRMNAAAINTMTFVGHATVRRKVLGEKLDRAATTAEIATMSRLVEQAMKEGAVGLSTGLEYDPALHSTTEEVIALARIAARHGGIYMSHIRDEGNRFFEALEEAVRIGREARIAVQVSHLKLGTTMVWGQSKRVVALIDRARADGVDITADVYPYDAWSSTIAVLVPSRRHEDIEQVRLGLKEVGGAERVRISSCKAHRDYEGKTLAAVAKTIEKSAEETYQQIIRDGGASVVCRAMEEEDVVQLMTPPWAMIASDGGIGGRHPRGAGTFPRVLGLYSRERKAFPLEVAIHKMTVLPARRLRLKDRGVVRAGFKADLVLFDPLKIRDRATFDDPQLLSEGIERVWVNGVCVFKNGKVTNERPGLSLARP